MNDNQSILVIAAFWLMVTLGFGIAQSACKKKGPSQIKWNGIPSQATPACGGESPEDRVYTCVFESVVYTCIQDQYDSETYVCAPKLFDKQQPIDKTKVPAEKPPADAAVGKDAS